MKIEPLYDKVVVKQLSDTEVTASGIVLPDSVDKEKPMSVKVGDKVLFTKYAPDEVEVDGEEYLVISEDKILGIIR